jgi:endonuclease III
MLKGKPVAKKPGRREVVRRLLERHPQSYADRLGIDVGRNTPAVLYQWLVASLLFSARISSGQAEAAARALFEQGWRTPKKMADVSWAARVKVLNRSGYARYDESTSRYIEETTRLLLENYSGDLRKLRDAAEHDPAQERTLLKKFKGIGEVGADIFFREVQLAWEELFPFADQRAMKTARKLGLGQDVKGLARVVERRDLPRLLSALIAVDLAKCVDEVLDEAG